MGVIKDVVKKVDSSKQVSNDLKESLNLLVSLADAKAQDCQDKIESDLKNGRVPENDTLYFPITHIAEKRVQYRCTTANTPGDLIDTISQSITDMFSDQTPKVIIGGIAKTANKFLEVLLGAGEGTEQFSQVYTTGIDGSGLAMSLVRTDFMFWCRKITASSLKKEMDSAISCVAYKSVIDVSKLKFDDFRNVYSKVVDLGLPANISTEERKTAILSEIAAAKEIFLALGGKLNEVPANNALDIGAIPPLELGIVTPKISDK